MQHHKKGRKFGRLKGKRISFVRNLSGDLIRAGKIETTIARAKEIRPIVEKMVTMAKKQTLAARRLLISRLHNTDLVEHLFNDIAPRYQDRAGGYLRIVKLGKTRKRDGVSVATIEFV